LFFRIFQFRDSARNLIWTGLIENITMTRRYFLAALPQAAATLPDIRSVAPDLIVPELMTGAPAPGRRVKSQLPGYGDGVYHITYLPSDWRPRRRYPIIVEYAGNGNFSNQYGDVSTGVPEGSNLGYGISAGRGHIWLCLPYVDPAAGRNATVWWGSPDATVNYCLGAVKDTSNRFGGDPSRVMICGFSRGSIACNYIGLRTDAIARLWRAFVCYSHYDGVNSFSQYADSDRTSALKRLQRLGGRPQFICDENGIEATRAYLASTGVPGKFTFQPLPFRNHNDAWVLRPVPLRKTLREWTQKALRR
jgi:hypothetical protein